MRVAVLSEMSYSVIIFYNQVCSIVGNTGVMSLVSEVLSELDADLSLDNLVTSTVLFVCLYVCLYTSMV